MSEAKSNTAFQAKVLLPVPNSIQTIQKKYPVNSKLKGKISSIKDFSIYINVQQFDIDGFLHANDLAYTSKPDDEIKKYKNMFQLR